ncbi:MAG: hypothetical protein II897_04130 [Clostridia bacterium]|nr:hypothetical protein [Clostridia bacterium]
MKALKKTIVGYAIAIAVGVILFFVCRPYALAHRADQTLKGGEYLLIGFPAAAVFVAKTVKKDIDEGTFRIDDTEEDE